VGYGAPPLETRFRPGQSGNPAGRPKRKTLTERIAALLECKELHGRALPDGMCVADLLAEAIVEQALKGKFAFVRDNLDRTEGKVSDRIAGPDGGPLIDLSILSDEDLDAFGRIAEKLGSVGPPADL